MRKKEVIRMLDESDSRGVQDIPLRYSDILEGYLHTAEVDALRLTKRAKSQVDFSSTARVLRGTYSAR